VNVIVPARFTPPAEVTLVNRTPTVHEAPGASVAPVHASAPATALKNQVRMFEPVPDATATAVTVADAPVAALPVFVNVTVPVPLRGLPPAANVIVSGFGVMDRVARAATPVPVSETEAGVTVAPV
jgi:hypothetical protein